MFLRQSTAANLHVGPIFGGDNSTLSGGGATLTLAVLFKANNTGSNDISGRFWSIITTGMYVLSLQPGDTDTLGPLDIIIQTSAGGRAIVLPRVVLSAAAFDALCGSARIAADVGSIAGNTAAADLLSATVTTTQKFTVQGGASTNTIPTDLSQAISSTFNGRQVIMRTGILAGQATQVQAYNGATKVLTVSQFTSAPAAGDQGVIV